MKENTIKTFENELIVYAVCKRSRHEVFICPYSEENLNVLLRVVEEYNTSA